MTRGEREILIERYLNGEMPSSQEQDFFIQVAVDKELRQELKAYRTVDSAFRKDREAERSEHTALRSRVAALLLLYPASGDPIPAGTTQYSGEGASSGGTLSRMAGGPAKWIAASGFAVLLAIGVYFLSPSTATPPAAPPPQQVTAPKPATLPAPSVPQSAAVDQRTTEATDGQTQIHDEAKPVRRSPAHQASGRTAVEGTNAVEHSSAPPAQASSAAPKSSERRRNDTLNVGLRIEFPKK